jgi:phosphoribosylaminoimidazole-succinocarboxamide synthase
MVATDRISAFDHVLPRPIPYKGQVLNQIAGFFLETTREIVPNWLESMPDPNVSAGKKCEPFPVEMVVRGYLAGHAWREYRAGKRTICGVPLPEGLKENDRLPMPIITPTTKAKEGHDEDISREEILKQNLVGELWYAQLEKFAINLFQYGQEHANKRGLILVDTKYEFGLYQGEIHLMDEIHTPDSSRYFYLEGYAENQASGAPQKQLSKEFVREWLMANGFQGRAGEQVPEMDDGIVSKISERYIELYELLTGLPFKREETSDISNRIKINIENYLN